MKIGYIAKRNLELNPHLAEKFKFEEASFTRRISSRGDRVYSKMLARPIHSVLFAGRSLTGRRYKNESLFG